MSLSLLSYHACPSFHGSFFSYWGKKMEISKIMLDQSMIWSRKLIAVSHWIHCCCLQWTIYHFIKLRIKCWNIFKSKRIFSNYSLLMFGGQTWILTRLPKNNPKMWYNLLLVWKQWGQLRKHIRWNMPFSSRYYFLWTPKIINYRMLVSIIYSYNKTHVFIDHTCTCLKPLSLKDKLYSKVYYFTICLIL